jgi:hypothetical protein
MLIPASRQYYMDSKSNFLARLGQWVAELVLVFIGVYAAFALNNYQQHQEQAKRRDQILAWLEHELKDGIESSKAEVAKQDKKVADFRHDLEAGKMPKIDIFLFSSDYSPSEIAALL